MSYRYAIKGMVCHRCDLALAELAEATGGRVLATGRGYAEFAERLPPSKERAFEHALEGIKFAILRSEGEEVAEGLELALQELVREQPSLSSARDLRRALSQKLDLPFQRAAALYQSSTGRTPLERFTTLRMEWAAARLREGRMQVGEVGYALGYRHLSGFSRAFKRVMGVSPMGAAAEWRAGENDNS